MLDFVRRWLISAAETRYAMWLWGKSQGHYAGFDHSHVSLIMAQEWCPAFVDAKHRLRWNIAHMRFLRDDELPRWKRILKRVFQIALVFLAFMVILAFIATTRKVESGLVALVIITVFSVILTAAIVGVWILYHNYVRYRYTMNQDALDIHSIVYPDIEEIAFYEIILHRHGFLPPEPRRMF